MNILELAILKKMVGGGGGSGTDNYNDLSNLPQINGETLAGNKSAENLGLQDALTFDSAPTEDSTNPVESGGVYNALAGKQDNLTFDGVYNASTNKAATESTVTNAIAGLDVSAFSVDADETISSISETDGKINVTKQDIAIASNQVTAMTGYTKPSSAPATPAIQTSDTANQAFGKLEFKADTNQTNILYALKTGVKNTFNLLEWCDPGIYSTVNGLNARVMEDGRIHIYGTMTAQNNTDLSVKGSYAGTSVVYATPTSDSYTLSATTEGNVKNSELHFYSKNTGPYDDGINLTSGTDSKTLHAQNYTWLMVRVPATTSAVDFYVTPMVSLTSIGNTDFEPFALPNYDLTRLQAEDRAALAEEIDSGAKNKCNWTVATVSFNQACSYTKTDTNLTITSTTADGWGHVVYSLGTFPKGDYVLSVKISSYSATNDTCAVGTSPTANSLVTIPGNGTVTKEFTLSSDGELKLYFYANYSGTAIVNSYVASEIMICTKAAFGVSNKFVPYRPNYDLVAQTVAHDIVFKKKSETITTANTWQVYSSLAVTLPVGKTIDITAAAEWSRNSPASDIAIIKGTTVTGTAIIATTTAPSGGQLSLCAHGMYYNGTNTDATINIAVKYPATENNQVSIAYRIF